MLGVVGIAGLTGCRSQPAAAYGVKTLSLTDFAAHADIVTRWRDRDFESKVSQSRTESEETIFEESVTLETGGSLFHPNLFEFGLAGVFGLVQEEFEEVVDGRKRDDTNSGELLEFDFTGRLFKTRDYPMTVFARRHRGIIPRPFVPSLETTTSTYGFTWQYVSEKIPTSLQFNYTDAKLEPFSLAGSREDEGRQKNTELRFETEYIFSDRHSLSLVYDHKSVEEDPFDIDYDSDEVTLTHRLEFGTRRQHSLRSEFNYVDQRGTIDFERTRLREELRLEHSDSLRSEIRFEAVDRSRGLPGRDVPRVDETSYMLSGRLRHQLFDSQITRLRLFVHEQEFEPDLNITRWGGQFDIDYRKTNRWGVLHSHYGFRAERNDNDGESRRLDVIDETHTFRDPDPSVLNNDNVIEGSIMVKSQDRVTIYQRGADYAIRTVGTRTEIERIPFGRIADGDTVFVDYMFDIGGNFELDTIGHSFDIREDFDIGLTPYYSFEWQDQSLSPRDATGALAEDITAHLVGVEFQKGSLNLFAEYEDHDSNINPFVSTRLGASYTHRFKSGATTSLRTRWTDTELGPPTRRDITLFTAEARHRHPITPNLTVEGSVLYRDGEDSLSADTDGVDVSLAAEWYYRATELRLSLEHSEFDDEFTESDSTTLFVHLKRRIWPQ